MNSCHELFNEKVFLVIFLVGVWLYFQGWVVYLHYSDKPCDACGNAFTRPAGVSHWQGGEGCRDQRRLDSKDSRKYKGASVDGVKKSTSAKNHRVGALGKANTAAKKATHAHAN